jgi:hypothetical protein
MAIWDRFRAGRSGSKTKKSTSDYSTAIAVVDASTVYGASRWYRGVHEDKTWKYAAQYRAAEDKLLFQEFLHDLALYDSIVLDRSSMDRLAWEIEELFEQINLLAGQELITARWIAPEYTIEAVVEIVCKILADAMKDSALKRSLLTVPIPWYYYVPEHHDRGAFNEGVDEFGLDPELIPAAIFLYRGICYSGYANSYFKDHRTPAVYLASPGRLKVMQPIVSTKSMELLDFPKHAYSDLVDLLGLPSSGYDFSHLKIGNASSLSKLSLAVSDQAPKAALAYVMEVRSKPEAQSMRHRWAKRIWDSSESAAIGANYLEPSNIIVNSTVIGDVTMIHALARNG